MIEKQDFNHIEDQLDQLASNKQLKTPEARELLDTYFDLIINYFKQINNIDEIHFNQLDTYPVVPMNFDERYHYMVASKHHFMGYRQMKTLKSELIKMNASYLIRKQRQQK
ncbi:YpoC family protein [Staphylococcus epidermidis]